MYLQPTDLGYRPNWPNTMALAVIPDKGATIYISVGLEFLPGHFYLFHKGFKPLIFKYLFHLHLRVKYLFPPCLNCGHRIIFPTKIFISKKLHPRPENIAYIFYPKHKQNRAFLPVTVRPQFSRGHHFKVNFFTFKFPNIMRFRTLR